MKTLILFYSRTGHTEEAASYLAEGIIDAGSKADIASIKDFDTSLLDSYDSFIAASPCWAGSVGSTGAAAPIVKTLNKIPRGALQGKECAAIAVHALKGGETTVSHLVRLLKKKGCSNVLPGPVAKAGNLAGIGKGPSVGEKDKARLKEFGRNFAK